MGLYGNSCPEKIVEFFMPKNSHHFNKITVKNYDCGNMIMIIVVEYIIGFF